MPTSALPLRPYPDCPLVVAYGLGVDSTAMLIEFVKRGVKPRTVIKRNGETWIEGLKLFGEFGDEDE